MLKILRKRSLRKVLGRLSRRGPIMLITLIRDLVVVVVVSFGKVFSPGPILF